MKGLTAAASLWTVAAIGLAVGGGLYVAAVAATLIILVLLGGIKPLEERFRNARGPVELRLRCSRGVITLQAMTKLLGWQADCVRALAIRSADSPETDDVEMTLSRLSAKDVGVLVGRLRVLPGVLEVEVAKTSVSPP